MMRERRRRRRQRGAISERSSQRPNRRAPRAEPASNPAKAEPARVLDPRASCVAKSHDLETERNTIQGSDISIVFITDIMLGMCDTRCSGIAAAPPLQTICLHQFSIIDGGGDRNPNTTACATC